LPDDSEEEQSGEENQNQNLDLRKSFKIKPTFDPDFIKNRMNQMLGDKNKKRLKTNFMKGLISKHVRNKVALDNEIMAFFDESDPVVNLSYSDRVSPKLKGKGMNNPVERKFNKINALNELKQIKHLNKSHNLDQTNLNIKIPLKNIRQRYKDNNRSHRNKQIQSSGLDEWLINEINSK